MVLVNKQRMHRKRQAARRNNPKKRKKGVLLELWEGFIDSMGIDANFKDFDQQSMLIYNDEVISAFEQYIINNVDGISSLQDVQIKDLDELADLTIFEVGQYYVPDFEKDED